MAVFPCTENIPESFLNRRDIVSKSKSNIEFLSVIKVLSVVLISLKFIALSLFKV